MKTRKISERSLAAAIAKWLKRRGFLVLEEVRLQPHSIDLVALNPRDLSLMAFEVKVRNWKKALRQSMLNRAFADFSYVAMPSRFARLILQQPRSEDDIGVLSLSVGRSRVRVSLGREASSNGSGPNRHFKRFIYYRFAKRYGERLSR